MIRNIEFKIVEMVDGHGVTKYVPKLSYQVKGMLWGWNNREIFIPSALQTFETYNAEDGQRKVRTIYKQIPNLKYHKLIDDGEYIYQTDLDVYQPTLTFTSLSEAEQFIEAAKINLEKSKFEYQSNQLTVKQ